MRRLCIILLFFSSVGCQSTGRFSGARDEVFDAALAAVPMTVGGMRLDASDRTARTFEGMLFDGFGNVYLTGRVRSDTSGDLTTVEVNCWEWSLKTLLLFPVDAKWAERRFLEALAERTGRASATDSSVSGSTTAPAE
jgi:hypothetical protein